MRSCLVIRSIGVEPFDGAHYRGLLTSALEHAFPMVRKELPMRIMLR